MFNRIGNFIEKRGISRYRFWQETQLGRDTAYRLCNDPTYIPTGSVLDKICSTYKLQPGEFLEWRDDEFNQNLAELFPPTDFLIEDVQNIQSSEFNSQIESLTLNSQKRLDLVFEVS